MKAMVLAAGQGTRLRPITDGMPKALVPVAGRPMIEFGLLLLRHYGVRDIVINLHHFGAQVANHLGDGQRFAVNLSYSHEPELLDTGGGLLKAKEFLQDSTFIVINTDALIDINLAEVLNYHRQHHAAATLVLRPDADADRYGSIDIGADGRICRFLEHRSPEPPVGSVKKLMFTGVQILEPRIFDYMDGRGLKKFSTTRETYPRMLGAGEKLCGYCFQGFWQDLGTQERIAEAERQLGCGQARLHFLQ
ncbi:MAG: nucleotidyltransferase family protein [Candidatus Binatia bacterium]